MCSFAADQHDAYGLIQIMHTLLGMTIFFLRVTQFYHVCCKTSFADLARPTYISQTIIGHGF